jgi:hypothetical protein
MNTRYALFTLLGDFHFGRQEFCENSFPPNMFGPLYAQAEVLCVEFDANLTEGCNLEMFDGVSAPTSWTEDVLQDQTKWNGIPDNQDITVSVEFLFEPQTVIQITYPYPNPLANVIEVNWRGEEWYVALDEVQGGNYNGSISGTFSFNSGPATMDGDMSTGLEIILLKPWLIKRLLPCNFWQVVLRPIR